MEALSYPDRAQLVRGESEQLTEYLQSLSPDDWARPSACDGWTIADVAAHLTGGAQFYTGIISRGLEGQATPPDGFAFLFGAAPEVMSAANAEAAVAYRKDVEDGLLEKFRAADELMNQTFARLSINDWETPCYHPVSVMPAWMVLSLRMFELAVHGWDIRSRFQPDAALPAESLAMSMDIVTAVCHYFFKPAASGPADIGAAGGRYRFQLTGAGLGAYDLVFDGGQARLEPAGVEIENPKSPDAVFQCSVSDFVLLVTRRLSLESAVDDRRLITEGGFPSELADRFEGLW